MENFLAGVLYENSEATDDAIANSLLCVSKVLQDATVAADGSGV
jgi:hypothetical protein